jgi:tetratricopeptide (TPR) repeat protein
MPGKKTIFLIAIMLSMVVLVYSNHFQNTFHFDDGHAVVDNPYIRELRNIPRFFKDAHTFTILPRNRMYRPVVSTTLAIDYWLGDGLDPFYFHLSTFCLYLLQLVLMYALFRRVCDLSRPDPRNRPVALLAAAWYGLHPAMAETVNYIVQRGDLYVALSAVAGVLAYAAAPAYRKYGLYLLPFLAGVLSKPPALIFPALLFVYIWLFENDAQPKKLGRALLDCGPALFMAGALTWLTIVMTPKEFNPGALSAYRFRITQPLVAWRFFRTFFIPDRLSADTGLTAVSGIWQDGAWLGFLFVIAAVAIALLCGRKPQWRPVAFGLWWFLLALLPTSVFPVYEVENDHRMFFPFIGLVLAVTWPVALLIYTQPIRRSFQVSLAFLCVCLLGILSLATVQRNLIWRTEESLWRDVTVKSPRSSRGMLNYAYTLMQKGDMQQALVYLDKARQASGSRHLVEATFGTVKGELNRSDEAEQHFRRAIQMNPAEQAPYQLYAKWLEKRDRLPEANEQAKLAARANPDDLNSFYLLLEIYAKQRSWADAAAVAGALLHRFPTDITAKCYLLMAAMETGERTDASLETAGNYLNMSLIHYRAGRFPDCIAAATEALKLRPRYPEAYNNMAAAYRGMEQWDQAVEAAKQALRIKPNFEKAQMNLARAEERSRK